MTLLIIITITSLATYPIILISSIKQDRQSDKVIEQTLKHAELLKNVEGTMIRLAFHRSAEK